MRVEIKIDPACGEPYAIIVTGEMTEEVCELAERLSEQEIRLLAGFRGDQVELLDPALLCRVYTEGGKVWAATLQGTYLLRMRLYEAERRLDRRNFVRISQSEIINLRQVRRFDLRLTGTICVELLDGTTAYVSRRYVARIRRVLGV